MNKIYSIWQGIFGRDTYAPAIDDPLQHLPRRLRADLPPWHEPAPARTDARGRPLPSITLRAGVQ